MAQNRDRIRQLDGKDTETKREKCNHFHITAVMVRCTAAPMGILKKALIDGRSTKERIVRRGAGKDHGGCNYKR